MGPSVRRGTAPLSQRPLRSRLASRAEAWSPSLWERGAVPLLSARLEHYDRDLAALAAGGVVLIAGVGPDRLGPEVLALLGSGDAGADGAVLAADLNRGLGVGPEV